MNAEPDETRLVLLAVPQPLRLAAALSSLLAAALAPVGRPYMRGDEQDMPLVAVDGQLDEVVAALDEAAARLRGES